MPSRAVLIDQLNHCQNRLTDVREAIDHWHDIASSELSSSEDIDAAYAAVKAAFGEYTQALELLKRMVNESMSD